MTQKTVTKTVLIGASALGLCVVGACSSASSPSSSPTPTSSSSPVDVCHATETVPLATQDGCDLPSATYEGGMAQKGASGALTFQLVSANGDAVSQGIDSWTLKITDANCAPVDGATVTTKMWMPEHNHGWTAATSTPEGGGSYDLGNMNFFMDGIWQITITASATVTSDAGTSSAVTDSTVFSFCVND